MYKDGRRYITRYSPDGGFDGGPCWEVVDRRDGKVIEGGYTQAGARQAAHYHNYVLYGRSYAQRKVKRESYPAPSG